MDLLKKQPLRESIQEAHRHFSGIVAGHPIPGWYAFQVLFSRFFIDYTHYCVISAQFQGCLAHLAWDEKLLHFTGDTAFIRLVPSKPDRVGLWFYELCCTLTNGKPFLVHARLSTSSTATGITIPVSEVVEDWAAVAIANRTVLQGNCPVLV